MGISLQLGGRGDKDNLQGKKSKIMHITKTVSKSQYQTKRWGACYSVTRKYLRNVYCVMTSHSKDQDSWTGHKTTN